MTDEAKVQEQETPAAPAEAPVKSADTPVEQEAPKADTSKLEEVKEDLKDAESKVEKIEEDVKKDVKKAKSKIKQIEEKVEEEIEELEADAEEVYEHAKKWFLEKFKQEDAAAAQPVPAADEETKEDEPAPADAPSTDKKEGE